jgi:CheY-like chemotaxis protein
MRAVDFMNHERTLLLVDDSRNDLDLMRVAFKEAGFNIALQEVRNGDDAIAYLKGDGIYSDRDQYPLPVVVLLDLNMPRKNGFEVLLRARTDPALRRISIIILTSSVRREDVERAFDLGANAFLVKPATLDELIEMVRCLRDWLEINHFPPSPQTVPPGRAP